eukprot:g13386.t1
MRAVTYSRQLMADRQAAVERMLAEDPAGFWADCASLARQIDDWPMIRLLCEKAASSGDRDALPWLVRSWAMPSRLVHDDERPEALAMASLTGAPADELLQEIVFISPERYGHATQVAAWTVLTRNGYEQWLRDSIDETPAEKASLLVSMLKRVAPAVDVLPADRHAIDRMMVLLSAFEESQWQQFMRYRVTKQRGGPWTIALRHLPAIQRRRKDRDAWSDEQWLTHIRSRLTGRRHVSRGESADDEIVVKQRPERLADYADRLGVADLIVIDQLLDAMQDPAVIRVAFEQAEADRLDTTTELGGALVWDEDGLPALVPYPPMLRRHDQAYIASTACLEAVYTGLAHFHFHTQRYDNAVWAGPGQGDLLFADTHHANAIVLTFIDQRTLNVDAYLPGGIIVDLGCMTRLGLVFCQLTGGGGSFSQDVKLTYFDVDSQTIRLVDHSYPDIPASPLEGTDNVFLAIVFSCEECEKGKIKDGMSPEDLKDNGMFIGWLERAPDGPDDEATARYGEGYLYRSLDNDRWFRDIDTGGQKIMQMPYDRCQNARVCTP